VRAVADMLDCALAVRVAVLVLGCAAVGWGSTTLPWHWRQSAIERIASRIIDGDPFKPGALTRFAPSLGDIEGDHFCKASALRGAAVFRLRMLEDAISAGEQQLIDPALTDLDRSIRRSLACSPAEPFLWLVLFWEDNTRNGFKPQNIAFLEMSYRLSQYEAWISLKRVPLALAMLRQLPVELVDRVVAEFIGLINSNYYLEMAEIFPHLDREVANLILAQAEKINLRRREAFAKELYRIGYDVSMPGVAPAQPRPWH
jgi:hypothetical protein